MSLQFFTPRGVDGRSMRLPKEYRRTVKWLPQINDIFPNFAVNTTDGPIDFWKWAEGKWSFLFSHPAAFTPVCTTEIAAIARQQSEFERLGLNALGLTGSSVAKQLKWHSEIEGVFKSRIWFPTAADEKGTLAALFGMKHEKEHASWPIRKSFILDPQMRIRMVFEYPIFIGRSIEEVLRVVEAMQLRDETGAATPADWFPNDLVIAPDTHSERAICRRFNAPSVPVLPYLRLVSGKEKNSRCA